MVAAMMAVVVAIIAGISDLGTPAPDLAMMAARLDRDAVLVPAGEFIMGSDSGRDDESPQHLVYLDAFSIDRFEVTNVQYKRYLLATRRTSPPYWQGFDYGASLDDYPVVGVN